LQRDVVVVGAADSERVRVERSTHRPRTSGCDDDEATELRAGGRGIRPAAAACCGARIIDPAAAAGRAAERTIRQMKR
jgi:hypothetical protein